MIKVCQRKLEYDMSVIVVEYGEIHRGDLENQGSLPRGDDN